MLLLMLSDVAVYAKTRYCTHCISQAVQGANVEKTHKDLWENFWGVHMLVKK